MSIQESAEKIATMPLQIYGGLFLEILEPISNEINSLVVAINSQYTKGEQIFGILVAGGITWVFLQLIFKIIEIVYPDKKIQKSSKSN